MLELENEIEKLKTYYQRRIKEVEDKHKYGKKPPKRTQSQIEEEKVVE